MNFNRIISRKVHSGKLYCRDSSQIDGYKIENIALTPYPSPESSPEPETTFKAEKELGKVECWNKIYKGLTYGIPDNNQNEDFILDNLCGLKSAQII